MEEKRAKLLLNMIPEIGSVRANKLLEHFGSADKIFSSSINELTNIELIGKTLAEKIYTASEKINIEQEIEKMKKHGIKFITSSDIEYPAQLRNISDPPPVLYYKGSITEEDVFSVAIVGTRRATNYGRIVTEKIVKELVELNVTVVSGLARGIDTVAHWTALKNGGRTIAVLGNGLGVHYPPENIKLENEIIKSGALISEFPVSYPPDRTNFPRRNRLIAGISLGTVVIEGDITSGALITARFALEQGKDVFAVPGNIFSKYSKGPHSLLKSGAKLVESAEDIVQEIQSLADWISRTSKQKIKKASGELPLLEKKEQEILEKISCEPNGIHIDKLYNLLGQPFSELSKNIVSLEIKGLIKSLPGKIYIRTDL